MDVLDDDSPFVVVVRSAQWRCSQNQRQRRIRLGRTDPCSAPVPHENVHLEVLQVDTPPSTQAHPALFCRTLRQYVQGEGSQRGANVHVVQKHCTKHKCHLH